MNFLDIYNSIFGCPIFLLIIGYPLMFGYPLFDFLKIFLDININFVIL